MRSALFHTITHQRQQKKKIMEPEANFLTVVKARFFHEAPANWSNHQSAFKPLSNVCFKRFAAIYVGSQNYKEDKMSERDLVSQSVMAVVPRARPGWTESPAHPSLPQGEQGFRHAYHPLLPSQVVGRELD